MTTKKATLFYCNISGEQKGPFPTSEIPAMLAKGEIRPDTMVWGEGLAEWLELKDAFKDVLPVPPPLAASKKAAIEKNGGSKDGRYIV
jgi:hypothetical protein